MRMVKANIPIESCHRWRFPITLTFASGVASDKTLAIANAPPLTEKSRLYRLCLPSSYALKISRGCSGILPPGDETADTSLSYLRTSCVGESRQALTPSIHGDKLIQ